MTTLATNIEDIHPSLWRGAQLGRSLRGTVDTGYTALSMQLPGGGWPKGSITELLHQIPGIGEMRLLAPALAALGNRPIVVLQPPRLPNVAGLEHIGIPTRRVILLNPSKEADALWSADQVLRSGTCGALLFWPRHVQTSSLRRLNLAAATGETLFFMFRPLDCARGASPAELRLALRPAEDALSIEIVKRKGPQAAGPVYVELHTAARLLGRRPVRRARFGRAPQAVASVERVG